MNSISPVRPPIVNDVSVKLAEMVKFKTTPVPEFIRIKVEFDPNASENGIGCGSISIPTWLLKKQKVAKVDRSDANSVWVSIFQKQDANGLTVNGYAL